jgi:hypothetical protein
MRLHQRASRATARAAAQARHKAAGQGLLPVSPNPAPIRNPTSAPRSVTAFICNSRRVSAFSLPVFLNGGGGCFFRRFEWGIVRGGSTGVAIGGAGGVFCLLLRNLKLQFVPQRRFESLIWRDSSSSCVRVNFFGANCLVPMPAAMGAHNRSAHWCCGNGIYRKPDTKKTGHQTFVIRVAVLSDCPPGRARRRACCSGNSVFMSIAVIRISPTLTTIRLTRIDYF